MTATRRYPISCPFVYDVRFGCDPSVLALASRGDAMAFTYDQVSITEAGDVMNKAGYGLSAASAAVNSAPIVGQIASVRSLLPLFFAYKPS